VVVHLDGAAEGVVVVDYHDYYDDAVDVVAVVEVVAQASSEA
jgi:hypothetical protein